MFLFCWGDWLVLFSLNLIHLTHCEYAILVISVFFICGILQIVFAILMVTKGVANLQTTTDTIQIVNNDLRVIIDAAVSNFEDLKQVGETAYVLRDQLVFDLQSDNFCPDNPTFAETKAGRDIMAAAGGAITMLEEMGNFIGSDVAAMEVTMRETRNSLDTIDVAIEDTETYEWLGKSAQHNSLMCLQMAVHPP